MTNNTVIIVGIVRSPTAPLANRYIQGSSCRRFHTGLNASRTCAMPSMGIREWRDAVAVGDDYRDALIDARPVGDVRRRGHRETHGAYSHASQSDISASLGVPFARAGDRASPAGEVSPTSVPRQTVRRVRARRFPFAATAFVDDYWNGILVREVLEVRSRRPESCAPEKITARATAVVLVRWPSRIQYPSMTLRA
jgi:hypothetical protein